MSRRSATTERHDPDAVVVLEEELAQQLRSLDDLEAEHEAGDLDGDDYRTLKDDYTIRVADTMRRLERQKALVADRATRSPARVAAVVGGLLVFAVAAGFLLARSTGERGVNDILTGEIAESSRQRVFRCQELGQTGDVVESLRCFDDVLLDDPENVEALTYRGWFVVLTIPSAEEAGEDEQAAELLAVGESYLDEAVSVDPTFPDARAFRSVVYDRQGRSDLVCAEAAELILLDPPPFFIELTRDMVERNGCLGS